MKAFIGITAAVSEKDDMHRLPASYVEAVHRAGGVPFVIPSHEFGDNFCPEAYVDRLDGLLLSGGVDVDPKEFGEQPRPDLGTVSPWRDEVELSLTRIALQRDIPILAICRGVQVLNVAAGGSLYQDLAEHSDEVLQHRQSSPGWHGSHSVSVEQGSRLFEILRPEEGGQCPVNSFHHQAINEPGDGLDVVARTPDGIIEAVEGSGRSFVLGVQWHPERMIDRHSSMMRLFESFVSCARPAAAGEAVCGG